MRILLRITALLLLLLSAGTSAQAQLAARLHDHVAAIVAGADGAARRKAITNSLDALGIAYHLDEFTFPTMSGANIVAELPGKSDAKIILLGAHYDRVAMGQGAVDNAASCAVLIELLAAFKAKPLANYTARAVFFDLEERGLVGSQAYFAKTRDSMRAAFALNMDIFGYGDTFFANASSADGAMITSFRQAAKDASLPVRLITSRNEYPASDHRIMMGAGIETIGLALIDGKEIDPILQHSTAAPRILTIIHTPQDTIDNVRAEDMEKAYPVVERMIRLLDGQ